MTEPVTLESLTFFDPGAEFTVVARRLPHWSQAGVVAFITWRTWDSIPEDVAATWLRDRASWLAEHGIDPTDPRWRDRLAKFPPADQREFQRAFSDRWQEVLDDCHGACVLRNPELSRIVGDSLQHFDGERYALTDYVVMPNHVHALVAFATEEAMLKQCEGWNHYTAVHINKRLGRKGRFWQVDDFDHLVRSELQFDSLRQYIADNPKRAGLRDGEFLHSAAPLPAMNNDCHSRSE
jgi:REP element-mobilizing transposase RayT